MHADGEGEWYNSSMLFAAFFVWWYGRGWAHVFNSVQKRLGQTEQMFSAAQLLRTLFAPWRRVISYPGSGLQGHVQALVNNTVSRFVGFTVRLLVLITAAITIAGITLVAVIEIIAWPLIPLAVLVGFIKGLWP